MTTDIETVGTSANPLDFDILKKIGLMTALSVLTVDMVAGWVFKPSVENRQIAVVSMETIMERALSDYQGQGMSREAAMLNTAFFVEYVQTEIANINLTGRYAAIVDSETVFGGDVVDLTELVFERSSLNAAGDNRVAKSSSVGGVRVGS